MSNEHVGGHYSVYHVENEFSASTSSSRNVEWQMNPFRLDRHIHTCGVGFNNVASNATKHTSAVYSIIYKEASLQEYSTAGHMFMCLSGEVAAMPSVTTDIISTSGQVILHLHRYARYFLSGRTM